MRYILAIILFTLFVQTNWAQQTPHYSLYDLNFYAHNPAYGGMDFELRMNAIYRSQWNGLEGAPERYHINGHLPLYAAYGAAGFLIQSEEIGTRQLSYYALSYNYVMSTRWGIFSFGVRPGIYQWEWDGSQLTTPDGNYEGSLIDHMDPALINSQVSGSLFNLDLGIHFQNEMLKAGIFTQQVLPSTFHLMGDRGYELNFEYGAYAQYSYDYSPALKFMPSAIIMSDGYQIQSALKFGILIDNNYNAGLGLRGYSGNTFDALLISGGLKMSENFWIYYNFDIGMSKLRSAHSGSHEIVISYRLDRQVGGIKPPKIIYNPRYLE